ncbi:MAG TPA: fused MFS/spermidine synthase [Candidatus Polarisedimenticolaceae bacterium]|nr:fused MFS/spermidine synthase [Candidatus Polarisedimenticolaceae bacterium]
MTPLLYLLVFFSGAAALIYEVAWVRSLSLVFGGSHLAVTVVLSVYMGGIALGGWLLGRRAESATRPLRLFGLLELGIGISAVAVLGLLMAYPFLYEPLARLAETDRAWLTFLRTLFSSAALLVPTTLMGGTLPALERAAPGRLAAIYGINTLGAVAGALGSGFLLLPVLGVRATIFAAVATNAAVGLAAIALAARFRTGVAAPSHALAELELTPVVVGIGVSGFCALGYEVLWTRMLTLVLGTSVYAFTIMLAAFLFGIGLGSHAEAWFKARPLRAFGIVQLVIGVSALGVTFLMRDLPSHAVRLQGAFSGTVSTEFAARQAASFAIAFATMSVPAFFMGVAFPLAAENAPVRRVLTVNTVGAILGAAASGFVLIPAFGIERALQMLVTVNLGVGAVVLTHAWRGRPAARAATLATAAVVAALAIVPGWGRAWNEKYFAIFRNTQRNAFDSAERIEDALENTDVLYYAEGANEIISVIQPRGGWQSFIVNGRPEATTSPMDMQCQRTLGHLPMLLHPHPRRVFVLGTGTGMTLGATSVHPGVESIVLAEIEPKALVAARTFAAWNHRVLDDPRLRIVLNDGRNYLATTAETFDVVTADPIHPWSGGAAYLYTAEYFRTVARHLNPGGIACQWLPIYELTPADLAMVVRTFTESFPHTMIWLTHYDAEIVGANAPIVLDEEALARRLAVPAVAQDLAAVEMGTVDDFLSFFLAGDRGARAFAAAGRVNTDDNLALEFSAPRSMGVAEIMGDNVRALAAIREPVPVPGATRLDEAAKLYDPAHALFLWGESDGAPFQELQAKLATSFPEYAPFRFLEREERARLAAIPRAIDEATFRVRTPVGATRTLTVSAVTMRIGERRAVAMFVDNETHTIFGQRYFDGSAETLDRDVAGFAGTTLGDFRASYARLGDVPAEAAVVDAFKSRLR